MTDGMPATCRSPAGYRGRCPGGNGWWGGSGHASRAHPADVLRHADTRQA